MKKKLISIVFMVVMLICMATTVSAAVEYEGSCGLDLTWTLDPAKGELRISGTGPMVDYSQNYEPWHNYNHLYTKVVVENGCTHIGNWAFAFSENLESVELPNTVKSIGSNAFSWNNKLVSCPLPDYLEVIGERAFINSKKLQGLDLPSTLTAIGTSAFGGCKAITVANIPGGVKKLPYGVFEGCSNLKTVTLGEGVESTEQNVFRGTAIVRITLPESFLTLGRETFRDCKNLISVTMMGCEYIKEYAFQGASNLKKVTLSPNLAKMDSQVFWSCSSLTHIRFPETLGYIPYGTMMGCGAVKQVVIENPECSVNDYAYLGQMGVCTIYGHKNSTAQTYALSKGYSFKDISEAEPEPSIFEDVNSKEYYGDAVSWAVDNNITSGTSDTKFSPDSPCTRAQIVTFLWRAMGSPKPTSTKNPFTDVNVNEYYGQAVLWAVENGITNGTSADKFSPDKECTRGQIVTFLWRAMDEQKPETKDNPFKDVDLDMYYGDAVLWAVENGITTGTGAGRFEPDKTCTRGQVVTFLYRAVAQ